MKLWLTKFRISNALDSGRPLPDSLRKKIAAEPELEQFTRRLQALPARLRKPDIAAPDLHNNIMRAVRTTSLPEPRNVSLWSWLAPAAGFAALVMCIFIPRPDLSTTADVSMDAPLAVLDLSRNMPAALPAEMMAPLHDELTRVNHDLVNTKDILAASVPFQFQ
jgi:hypothetical protein